MVQAHAGRAAGSIAAGTWGRALAACAAAGFAFSGDYACAVETAATPVIAPVPDDLPTARGPSAVVSRPLTPTPANPSYSVAAAPTAVMPYHEVGQIPDWTLGHHTHHSLYNPYIDNLLTPARQTVWGPRHARYYAGYRPVPAYAQTPNYYQVEVPRAGCQTCRGAGGGVRYQTNYGPAPAVVSVPTGNGFGFPYAYQPQAAYLRADSKFSGEPQFYAPYGYTAPPGFSALPADGSYGRAASGYFGVAPGYGSP